jgi:hypothetical protein
MSGVSHQPRRSNQGNRCYASRKVWCECQLPLHRGARHAITSRQKKRHKAACREQHILFTDAEAELAQASKGSVTLYNTDSTLSDSETSVNNTALDFSNVNHGPDEDDRPDISDWIQDVTITTKADREEVEISAHDIHMKSLDMFDAFIGTPREKVKKMRQAIAKHYSVDIGDPTRIGRRVLQDLVGDLVQPVYFDCCADGCVAFTGRLLVAAACPTCGKGRYDHNGNSRYTFQYIPLVPRLRIQYSHLARSRQLSSYRSTFDPSQPDDGARNDVFDGSWFKECWAEGYFQDHRDLAMRLTLDAIGTVKHAKKRQTITPVVIYLLNLHPNTREQASNALTTHIIPGGFDKDYTDTWLHPLVAELHQLRYGIEVYDGASEENFTLKAHIILVTGDGPAIADVMGTKSPGKAKQSCRMCTFSGTLGRGGKYFYPNGEAMVTGVNLDMRLHIEDVEQHRVASTSQRDFNNLRRDRGVNCRSILMDLPTIHFPRSFPIDTMHSMNHNIPKHMFHLWKGSKYQKNGQEVEKYPWVLPSSDWTLIDHGLAASRGTVPTRVGTAPRGTSSFANWTTHEWRSFFLTYGAPAMHYFLPTQYATNFLRYRQLLRYTNQRAFTCADIAQVEARSRMFLYEYEDLYYGNKPDLLPSCTIQYHYLLHLGQNIRDFGPPLCYAQWSLERFLRTVKRFATSTLYKHQSAEINALIREQRIHTKWSNAGYAAIVDNNDIVYADDENLPTLVHKLIRRTNTRMDTQWRRELERIDDPLAQWHTGTSPDDMIMYRNVILPTGSRVGTFSPRLQSLVLRNNAFIMYYEDLPANSRRETVQLSFGTVVTLFMDPFDSSQWAGVAKYHKVQPASNDNCLPRPRIFDENTNSIIWILVDRIVDLVGAAQVYHYKGSTLCKSLFLVDKQGHSEIDSPQQSASVGPDLSVVY